MAAKGMKGDLSDFEFAIVVGRTVLETADFPHATL